jgi:hypothetical protein
MTGLLMRKEENQERLGLSQLQKFLEERHADDVLKELKTIKETIKIEEYDFGLQEEYCRRAGLAVVAMLGSNKLVSELHEKYPEVREILSSGKARRKMIENMGWHLAKWGSNNVRRDIVERYPEVLKIAGVASNIAIRGNNKVRRKMIENHPEVLGMTGVARNIAIFGNDEVRRKMIENHPEVLGMTGVASDIAELGGDEVWRKMIDSRPKVLEMKDVLSNLAFKNRSKVVAYALLVRGEIKPKDIEFTARQFSTLFSSLGAAYFGNYWKEKVLKRIFLDTAAISSRKELEGMSLPYRALVDMLNIPKKEAEKLSRELSESEGNVERALPLKGLAYALTRKDGIEMLNNFIRKSKSVMDALNLFPMVCELMDMDVIENNEFLQISNSEDKEAELFKQVAGKTEKTFNAKPESADSIMAMSDYRFIVDLFGLYSKYHGSHNKSAETVLINVVKNYFEGGIRRFKEFKFSGHELAGEQLGDASSSPLLRERLMDLDKLGETYTSKRPIAYDSVRSDIDSYMSHRDVLHSILDKIEADSSSKLSKIAESARSKELASLLSSRDLKGLTSKSFDPDDEKVKSRGIALIKMLNARDSLGFVEDIIEELQKMPGKPKEEQDTAVAIIANRVGGWVGDKGIEPIKMLKNYLSKIKDPSIHGIEGADLPISANAINNAISVVNVLLDYRKAAGETTVTAQITFDPSKLLTFGRCGSSGAGNCQSSNGKAELNQSLMSMVGDANQFMIMFQKPGDTEPLGFMQVHLLKSNEKGMVFFMENPYTNEPDKATAMKEAARMLAQKIKRETGLDCFTYGGAEEIEVEVPRSYVRRYIDFAGLMGPESFKHKIRATCLTPFELRR